MLKRLIILLLLAGSSFGAMPWPLTVNIPETPDSIRARHYYGGTLYEDLLYASASSITRTWQLQENALNQIVFLVYYSGADSAVGWTFARDLKTSYGATESWRLFGAKWAEPTDSVTLGKYHDGALVGALSTRGSTVRSYDTTLYASAGKYNEARLTLYYPSSGTATWAWAWDMTDTSTGTTMGTGDLATGVLTGRLFLKSGLPAQGATIIASAGAAVNLAHGTATRYIVIGEPVVAYTDTAGLFSMNVATTGSYADTTQGFYTVTGLYGGKEVFKIANLWVGTGTVNLADSLAGRTR